MPMNSCCICGLKIHKNHEIVLLTFPIYPRFDNSGNVSLTKEDIDSLFVTKNYDIMHSSCSSRISSGSSFSSQLAQKRHKKQSKFQLPVVDDEKVITPEITKPYIKEAQEVLEIIGENVTISSLNAFAKQHNIKTRADLVDKWIEERTDV